MGLIYWEGEKRNTVFSKNEINTGRQNEFDYLKGIFMLFIPAKQRAKRELARIWRLPRGSNTPPLWGELAKKKLSHAPLLAAGYLTYLIHAFQATLSTEGSITRFSITYCSM